MRYGLIAGNGRFPILALESAQGMGYQITVIAIQEEAAKEVEALAERCHWISLGQLSKLIDICKKEEITEVITHMAFYAGWPAAMSAAQVAYTVLVEGNKGE